MDRQRVTQQALSLLMALLVGVCAGMLIPSGARFETTKGFADGDIAAAPAFASWRTQADEQALAGEATPLPSETPAPHENLFAITVLPSLEATPETPVPEAQDGFAIEVVSEQTQSPRKKVLIYHTHTYEAYAQDAQDPYEETERWRTADSAHNVVRVGEELAALLRALGVDVVHDTTAFEPPALSSAYARSLEMLTGRLAAGERYDLYIDLHRDAYVEGQAGPNALNLGGQEVARMMLLIGKGEGQTSQGFDERPNWQENLRIAQAVTENLNAQAEGLCRNVRVKTGRYNQHVDVGCLLIEAGNNQNTLAQTLNAMPYLADALYDALLAP